VAQDFWASSGYRHLEAGHGGLIPTNAWLATFLQRPELLPPEDAGPREREVHAFACADPRGPITARELAAIEDETARVNWQAFLAFREHVLAFPTLEAAYRALFAGKPVSLSPSFVDALAHTLARASLEGIRDPWLCRAAEMFFRPQRVSNEDGRILAADAATVEAFAETGGFGEVGRMLRRQGTDLAPVKMDVLTHENADLYWMRDELYSFVLDLTPAREGATALARALERWVGRLAGVAVAIEPVARVDDERWRWHVGLDAESTAILNALYQGEPLDDERRSRIVALFRLRFADPRDALAEIGDAPVYLGLACRADRTMRMKPQNLLANLPLAVK
jgi:hypothetical protein